MAQETQKPTANKDFDFILNQNPEQGSDKKGPDKKVIAIIVLVIVTLLVMGLSFFIGTNKKVQKSNETNNTTQNPDKTQQEKADDVVESFLIFIKEKNYNEAYAQLDNKTSLTRQTFDEQVTPFFGGMEVTSCMLTQDQEALIDGAGNILRSYNCKHINSENMYQIDFYLSSDDSGEMKIINLSEGLL